MPEKLKSIIKNDHIFYGLVIVLVAIASFFLGRLSSGESATSAPNFQLIEPLTIKETIETIAPTSTQTGNVIDGSGEAVLYVASKSGKKYHLPTCPGAKQIKTENKITFNSKAAAEAAGYEPAANCPELQ
jgi:Metal binding domain of Ada